MYYNDMSKAKKKRGAYQEISDALSDAPDLNGNPEENLIALEENRIRAYRIQNMENVLNRLSSLRNSDDILYEFGSDAARLLVIEMHTARSSADRLKAIQQVLDRTLGKPIDRSITLNHNVKELKDEELDAQIKDMLHDLNYITGSTRRSVSLLIEGEAEKREIEVGDSANVGLAGEVSSEFKED